MYLIISRIADNVITECIQCASAGIVNGDLVVDSNVLMYGFNSEVCETHNFDSIPGDLMLKLHGDYSNMASPVNPEIGYYKLNQDKTQIVN